MSAAWMLFGAFGIGLTVVSIAAVMGHAARKSKSVSPGREKWPWR